MSSKPQASAPESDGVGALARLAELGHRIGFDIVEVGGFLDALEADSREQVSAIAGARAASDDIAEAATAVRDKAADVSEASATGLEIVMRSVDVIRNSGQSARSVAEWVQRVEGQMAEIARVLETVNENNRDIRQIAKQVNMLAINAKIEATHAGDAGRGFAVVADAINELSRKTAEAGDRISRATDTLTDAVTSLSTSSVEAAEKAGGVLRDSETSDGSLTEIADQVRRTATAASGIADEAARMEEAASRFRTSFAGFDEKVARVSEDVANVRGRVENLIDVSEGIVQVSVEAGGALEDAPFIEHVLDLAARVSDAFETGIATGRITREALFTRRYDPIPGTDPKQVMAPFTRFTDEVLPPIQEAALGFAPSVVFCAAVDTNGYLPTHNRKFSQPQGNDPVWNAANCRNRRIFDDRVGLKAGRNTETFLMQIYRRDMGGGTFVMMKDLSAPIFVGGQHWGGLRFAYKV